MFFWKIYLDKRIFALSWNKIYRLTQVSISNSRWSKKKKKFWLQRIFRLILQKALKLPIRKYLINKNILFYLCKHLKDTRIITGTLGIILSLIWFSVVYDSPEKNPHLSEKEQAIFEMEGSKVKIASADVVRFPRLN